MNRRVFIRNGALVSLLTVPGLTSFLDKKRYSLGVCTSVNNSHLLKKYGYDFVEDQVRKFLVPRENEETFEQNLKKLKSAQLPVYAVNSFLPGDIKSVGDDMNENVLLEYADTSFKRAKQAGVKIIVYGSGGSRKIPDGFSHKRAKEQFISLLVKMAPLAEKQGIIICLEPLKRDATNFINTVSEGGEIVAKVNHPHVKMVVDFYHMLCNNENPRDIEKLKGKVAHCHIAEEKERRPPGTYGENFRSFFKALQKINYSGKVSIECRWKNLEDELPVAYQTIMEQS